MARGKGRRRTRPRKAPSPNFGTICGNADQAQSIQGMLQLTAVATPADILNPPPITLVKDLAGSQASHLVDAWSYAAGAVRAYINGHPGLSVHLGYYAELRSAMSLFSGSGICVQYPNHYYVDTSGIRHPFSGPTHDVAWKLWEEWVKRSDAANLLSDNLYFLPGIKFADLLDELGTRSSIEDLVRKWGYDLIALADDHTARNKYSYEAYRMETPHRQISTEDISFIQKIWRLLLPIEPGLLFDHVYMLFIVNKYLDDLLSQFPEAERAAKRTEWLLTYSQKLAARTGQEQALIHQKLTMQVEGAELIAFSMENQTDAKNVICRALFLLRLATCSLKERIENHDSTERRIQVWISFWLQGLGLWDPTAGIEPKDVATDYEEAIAQMDLSKDMPFTLWKEKNARYTLMMGKTEAALVWNIF